MYSIEHSIFKSLLKNETFARMAIPYLDIECFDDFHKTLFSIYKTQFENTNKIPTLETLAISLQKTKGIDIESILEFVEQVYADKEPMPDTDWLINETEEYCRNKKLYNAIYKSIDILDGQDKKLDKNAIPSLLTDALSVSFREMDGLDYFTDIESRYEYYTAEENTIKFPLSSLNILSNGGLRRKTLSGILAGTNVGKSTMMCFLAGEFVKVGYNVCYITLEMSEFELGGRIDANLINITTDNLKKMNKSDYVSKLNAIKSKTNGKLIIKEYPTLSAGSSHFRSFLNELKSKRNFIPDVVFVDYLNICASARYGNGSGVNSYSYIKSIAEELRGLACETNTAFITATQINREAGKSEHKNIGMESTSDSYGVPFTMDWFIALLTDEVLADNNRQLVKLLKTRWGNKTKSKPQLVGIDFDYMRYYDVDSAEDVKTDIKQNQEKNKDKIIKNGGVNKIEWD